MIDIVSHHQMLINVVAYQKVCDKCIAVWCQIWGRAQRWVVVYQKVCDKCISAWCQIGGWAQRWMVVYQRVCDKCIAVWCWIGLNEIQDGEGRKRVCMVCGFDSYGTEKKCSILRCFWLWRCNTRKVYGVVPAIWGLRGKPRTGLHHTSWPAWCSLREWHLYAAGMSTSMSIALLLVRIRVDGLFLKRRRCEARWRQLQRSRNALQCGRKSRLDRRA